MIRDYIINKKNQTRKWIDGFMKNEKALSSKVRHQEKRGS